ncbi:MAG: hypothetical protein QHH75_13975 [Bacillota bacterium]|nr:hypothetical protein [Bacillota bacterium]
MMRSYRKKQKMLQEQYFYLAPAYEEAVFAGRLRREWLARGYTLALSDVTNAALAISRKLALVTRNVSHYPFSEACDYWMVTPGLLVVTQQRAQCLGAPSHSSHYRSGNWYNIAGNNNIDENKNSWRFVAWIYWSVLQLILLFVTGRPALKEQGFLSALSWTTWPQEVARKKY